MEWTYGWLVKGRCEVSMLDGAIFMAEAGLVLWAAYLMLALISRSKP